MARKANPLSKIDPRIRKAWGWHDGVNARRWPQWCRPWQDMAATHFDSHYGAGFRAGYYGEPHPVTGEANPKAASQAA